ncbi:MAG: hypothetical protein KDA65_03225 [Planctomycetaceae bacterium]|nr:hypothetical protein [Planctomycetaceae bacterium]
MMIASVLETRYNKAHRLLVREISRYESSPHRSWYCWQGLDCGVIGWD